MQVGWVDQGFSLEDIAIVLASAVSPMPFTTAASSALLLKKSRYCIGQEHAGSAI